MVQDRLEILNFHEWWSRYNEERNKHNCTPFEIGGDTWMAAFAAWQYAEIVAKQKPQEPAKNFVVQMEVASKMVIKLSCPFCGSGDEDLKLLRIFGQIREYLCNKCQREITVE